MIRALGFLSVIGRGSAPDARTVRWFPVVGALLGAVVGGVWWGADRLWPPLVVATIVVTADLAVTGLLHLDGLADSADGLLPHLPRERRLAVMAEVDVGAFGIGIVVIVLLLRASAIASRPVSVLLIVGLWCASRSLLAIFTSVVPYARPGGLASSFVGDRSAVLIGSVGVFAGGAAATVGAGRPGLTAAVALVLAASGVVALARVRIGGFTGDVLGAALLIGETVGLVVAAARW